jgi:hypothetical protein
MTATTTLVQALCTPCTQAETRISMRGIKSGVWTQLLITKLTPSDQVCDWCQKKKALFLVTSSS